MDLALAVATLARDFDDRRGGFGGAPKFPPSMVLEFLLRHHALTQDENALGMAQDTLEAMARGGIYDQLGGGFARYSVDADWVVPHFEKMLYDNALLLRVYLHWWRLTGSPLAERVVRETAEFLLREMRTPEGGFAAALDADSEGREGAFYAWSPSQLADVLGDDDGAWAAALLHVTADGTFEHGLSTLQLRQDPDDHERWSALRSRLLDAREERPRPGRDDKVVASWNGLAIAAMAEAGALLGRARWVEAALAAADLLVAVHLGAHGDDRLCRTSRDGRAGSNEAVLDDYGERGGGIPGAVPGDGRRRVAGARRHPARHRDPALRRRGGRLLRHRRRRARRSSSAPVIRPTTPSRPAGSPSPTPASRRLRSPESRSTATSPSGRWTSRRHSRREPLARRAGGSRRRLLCWPARWRWLSSWGPTMADRRHLAPDGADEHLAGHGRGHRGGARSRRLRSCATDRPSAGSRRPTSAVVSSAMHPSRPSSNWRAASVPAE